MPNLIQSLFNFNSKKEIPIETKKNTQSTLDTIAYSIQYNNLELVDRNYDLYKLDFKYKNRLTGCELSTLISSMNIEIGERPHNFDSMPNYDIKISLDIDNNINLFDYFKLRSNVYIIGSLILKSNNYKMFINQHKLEIIGTFDRDNNLFDSLYLIDSSFESMLLKIQSKLFNLSKQQTIEKKLEENHKRLFNELVEKSDDIKNCLLGIIDLCESTNVVIDQNNLEICFNFKIDNLPSVEGEFILNNKISDILFSVSEVDGRIKSILPESLMKFSIKSSNRFLIIISLKHNITKEDSFDYSNYEFFNSVF